MEGIAMAIIGATIVYRDQWLTDHGKLTEGAKKVSAFVMVAWLIETLIVIAMGW